jgi:hypothetical protein
LHWKPFPLLRRRFKCNGGRRSGEALGQSRRLVLLGWSVVCGDRQGALWDSVRQLGVSRRDSEVEQHE